MKKVGLFLGAGASCELCMPLVWDLTSEIKEWLTPEKLKKLNEGWIAQGGGYSDDVIADCSNVISMSAVHYESILGYLETQFRRNNLGSDPYHAIYSKLIEIVYYILYVRHIENVDRIKNRFRYFEGFKKLSEMSSPFWIFSLNHDLLVECLAAHQSIEISSGFTSSIVSFPRRDQNGVKIGEVKAETITGDEIENSAMNFLKHGTPGINLLKIHGALDVFTFRDGKDLLKVIPDEKSVEGVIESLRIFNEELLYIDKQGNPPVKVNNEIVYADDEGEMQFLRRTLLSGAYKYDSRRSQVFPKDFLKHFVSNLNYVEKLVCIGYGFGDEHINKILRAWLEFSKIREIEIVNPFIDSPPQCLLHVAPQVKLIKSTMSEYLDSIAGIVRTREEVLQKETYEWGRKNRNSKSEFIDHFEKFQSERIKSIVNVISKFPVKNGDIDIEALGMTKEELVSKVLKENSFTMEAFLEDFLKSRQSKKE